MANTPIGGLNEGITRGMQLSQFMQEKRNQEWQKKYQQAALGVTIAANKDLPANVRLKGLNNGLLPLWNDPTYNVNGNNATPLPQFTEQDLQNQSFQDTLKRAVAVGKDKDLAPSVKRDSIAQLFAEYHAQRGETDEAMKMILEGEKSSREIAKDNFDRDVKERQTKALEERTRLASEKQAAAVADKSKKEQGLVQSSINQADTVISKVETSMNKVNGWSTGWGAKFFSGVPGSKAKSLQADLNTIKANLGFSTLQEMRRNSPTGGALGQIAVQELNMLQSTVDSLDQELSGPELSLKLQSVKTHFQKWKNAVQQAGQEGVPTAQDEADSYLTDGM